MTNKTNKQQKKQRKRKVNVLLVMHHMMRIMKFGYNVIHVRSGPIKTVQVMVNGMKKNWKRKYFFVLNASKIKETLIQLTQSHFIKFCPLKSLYIHISIFVYPFKL